VDQQLDRDRKKREWRPPNAQTLQAGQRAEPQRPHDGRHEDRDQDNHLGVTLINF
jgi:hypothetical protein